MTSLSSLNVAVLSEILSYVEPVEMVCLILCSNELAHLINKSDLIWHALARSWYELSTKQPNQSWRESFIAHYTEYPSSYLPHYRTIKQLWNRLHQAVSTLLPSFDSTLLPGVSKDTIDRLSIIERVAALSNQPVVVPYDWLMFNRLVGGQALIDVNNRETYFAGALGGYSVYDTIVNDRLIPFENAIDQWLKDRTARLLPISVNHYARLARAQSWFFAYLIDSRGQIVRRTGHGDTSHVISPSFTAFLTDYVTKLEAGLFEANDQGICRSLRDDPMGSVAVTEGIRVRVSVLYIPEMSIADDDTMRHTFTYHIKIDHDCSTSIKAKLTTRRWTIIDGSGHEEEVEGPGVIGKFPTIYPGCPVFEYNSISGVQTTTGSMHGYFLFKVEGSERIINVRVGEFRFDPTRNAV